VKANALGHRVKPCRFICKRYEGRKSSSTLGARYIFQNVSDVLGVLNPRQFRNNVNLWRCPPISQVPRRQPIEEGRTTAVTRRASPGGCCWPWEGENTCSSVRFGGDNWFPSCATRTTYVPETDARRVRYESSSVWYDREATTRMVQIPRGGVSVRSRIHPSSPRVLNMREARRQKSLVGYSFFMLRLMISGIQRAKPTSALTKKRQQPVPATETRCPWLVPANPSSARYFFNPTLMMG